MKALEVGDKVESSKTGWGQPFIRGTIIAIERSQAVVQLEESIGNPVALTRKRSLRNLRRQT